MECFSVIVIKYSLVLVICAKAICIFSYVRAVPGAEKIHIPQPSYVVQIHSGLLMQIKEIGIIHHITIFVLFMMFVISFGKMSYL